jgi:hypothetical protein
MTAQEVGVLVIGLAAAGYAFVRFVIRRRASTCCGESTCPAAKRAVPETPPPRQQP